MVMGAQMEARFGSFGDSANRDSRLGTVCADRTVSSEMFLDASDGTPT
jgi:hypothetical protein